MRLLSIAIFLLLLLSWSPSMKAQLVDDAAAGVELCDCLPADSYLLVKKLKIVGGEATTTYHANVEVLISFLTAYGVFGAHAMNLNWPADLVVGAGDLTALLTGFNHYPAFEESLCSWEVVNVASHGWILEEIDATAFTEAYVHESTYDEFDLGDETYGQCLLNSFDLEMVHLPDSVVRLTFVRKFLGNPTVD